MIHDVDESLRALIRRDALNGAGVEVALDAPTKEWASRQNAPTLSVYLYDVREDTDRRQTGYEDVRDESGRVIERRPPARRFRLSYIVTAWTQRPEDEHRLLSAVLSTFVRHDVLPLDVLAGELAGQEVNLMVTLAQPDKDRPSITDVWSALGGNLKPSIDVCIVAPLDTGRVLIAEPVVLDEPRLRAVGAGTDEVVSREGRRRRRDAGST